MLLTAFNSLPDYAMNVKAVNLFIFEIRPSHSLQLTPSAFNFSRLFNSVMGTFS